jgi:hypothetical protein
MPKPKRSGTGHAKARPAARPTGPAAGRAGQRAADPGQWLAGRVLHAARDIGRVETAFDAELLLSTLLGSVYATELPDRGPAHDRLVAALRTHPDRSAVVSRVLAALTQAGPPAGTVDSVESFDSVDTVGSGGSVDTVGSGGPAWVAELGRVRVAGAYAYGDRYGDQTTYLTTFEYENPMLGGPDHAVAVLVDHNLGIAKDLLVVSPAGGVLEQIRASVATDPEAMTWFAEIDPGTVRAAATAYLRATDTTAEPPDEESLPANRALVLARLASLPALRPSTTESTTESAAQSTSDSQPGPADFLESPDARLAGLTDIEGEDRASVSYCLGLIVDFGRQRGGDPLRWSPRSVELFLLDWVHQHAVLDADDQRFLPDVLGAWLSWAGRRLDLPIPAINETISAVRRLREEFARLCASGERRSPAARAMAEMLAAGVDPGDSAALDAWIRDNLSP